MKKVTQKQFDELLAKELAEAQWYSKAFSTSEYYDFIDLCKSFLLRRYTIKK